MPLEVGACAAGTSRQRERKSERARGGHSTEDSVDLCIFWQGMGERTVRTAHSQTPHTHWTFIPSWQMTRFYEAPWAPSTSPQSSHSAHQHPQQRFSPHHAPLMWDRAKPCNTKRLGIIHTLTPVTPSLTGREQFSTDFRGGRFVLMSRENSRSGSSRPSSLTYAQLGVVSSPEEKIIQRELRENRERFQFSECYVSSFTPHREMTLCVCVCRGFSLAGAPLFDFMICFFYVRAAFSASTLKSAILNFYSFFHMK